MAYEILKGVSLYDAGPVAQPGPSVDSGIQQGSGAHKVDSFFYQVEKPAKKPIRPRLKIVPNFQHDLESLWWISLWFLLARVDHRASQTFATIIFVNTTHLERVRADIFVSPDELLFELETFIRQGLGEYPTFLDQCRISMVEEYKSRKDAEDVSSYTRVFETMFDFLGNCSIAASNINGVRLVSEIPRAGTRPGPSSTTLDDAGGEDTAGGRKAQKRRQDDEEEGEEEQDGQGGGGGEEVHSILNPKTPLWM